MDSAGEVTSLVDHTQKFDFLKDRTTLCTTLFIVQYIIIQVNEKFYKLERVYRDCIKMTRDKTRIYSLLHDAPGAS